MWIFSLYKSNVFYDSSTSQLFWVNNKADVTLTWIMNNGHILIISVLIYDNTDQLTLLS